VDQIHVYIQEVDQEVDQDVFKKWINQQASRPPHTYRHTMMSTTGITSMAATEEMTVTSTVATDEVSLEELLGIFNLPDEEVVDDLDKEAANIVANLHKAVPNVSIAGKKRNLNGELRKPPVATKCCNLCKNTFQVPAPKKKCMDGCIGLLELVAKEPNELKRPPPKCDKFCSLCNKTWVNVATASKKCGICKSVLEKAEKKTGYALA
jgi:hypothetical protein